MKTLITACVGSVVALALGTIIPVVLQENVAVAIMNNSHISVKINHANFVRPPGVNFYYLDNPAKVNAYENVQKVLDSNIVIALLDSDRMNVLVDILDNPVLLNNPVAKKMLSLSVAESKEMIAKFPKFTKDAVQQVINR